MRILLVSTRGGPEEGSWGDLAAAHAELLSRAGQEVSWLHVRAEMDALPQVPQGIRFLPLESQVPPFRMVTARLGDLNAEQALSKEIRPDPPDLLHVFGFGGTGSTSIPWLAGRLGVPSAVSLDLAETLCHRGNLIDFEGSDCERRDDPQRCWDCSLTPFAAGLSPIQARLARISSIAGGLSPYPNLISFQNRLDLIRGGLAAASRLLLEDERSIAALQEFGIAQQLMMIRPDPEAKASHWLELYSACLE